MAKILLVEDDPFLTTMYKTRFEGEGHEVIVAQDGETALSILKQKPPDVLILDVMLPKLSGFSILTEMQKSSVLKKVPVIVLSNLADEESVKKAQSFGIKEFLIKTKYTPTQIYDVIKKYLPSGLA